MRENKWLYLGLISLVWGSSFILMKKALLGLSPVQVAACRILFAGLILMTLGYRRLRNIQKKYWKPIAWVALSSTFFPSFFFSFAISEIDSSVSAILNSLTPLITLLIGCFFFGFSFSRKQVGGVFFGLLGTVLLIARSTDLNPDQNYAYAVLIFLSSAGYAYSLNLVKTKLADLDALSITVGCFSLLLLPSFLILIFSDTFGQFRTDSSTGAALFYVGLLAVFGTVMAKVAFHRLVQISSPLFSSSVTYLITVVAVLWGVWDGEHLTVSQLFSVSIVFLGLYLVNRTPTS